MATKKTKFKAPTNLKDLYQFFKGIPRKDWANGTMENITEDDEGNNVVTRCAVGHLRNAVTGTARGSETAHRKVENLLTKLGVEQDELINANDGTNKRGPKEAVLKFLKRKIKAQTKTKKTAKKK